MTTSIMRWVGSSNPDINLTTGCGDWPARCHGTCTAVWTAALSFYLPVNNDPIHAAITASRPADRSVSVSSAYLFSASFRSAAPDAVRFIRVRGPKLPRSPYPLTMLRLLHSCIYCRTNVQADRPWQCPAKRCADLQHFDFLSVRNSNKSRTGARRQSLTMKHR